MPGEDQALLAQPQQIAPTLADLCEPSVTSHAQVIRL
jgi:hypothetical protein